jgi:hypothetical protein
MRIRRTAAGLALALAAALMLPRTACPHEGRGGIAALPQASTRGLAMGETGLTEPGEGETFMSNVACLTSIEGNQMRLTYGNWFQDLGSSRTVLLWTRSLGRKVEYPGEEALGRTYGLGVAFDRTGVELSQGSGWAMNVLYVGLAWAPMPYLSTGLSPKILFSSSDLESGKVSGYAVDWGMRMDVSARVSVAFVVRNLPASAGWDNGEIEDLPVVYAGGGHVLLPYGLSGEFMFAASVGVDEKLGGGLEMPFLDDVLEVRAGALRLSGGESRTAVTTGFGVNLTRLDFDYAVKFDEDWAMGTTHRLSLRFDF